MDYFLKDKHWLAATFFATSVLSMTSGSVKAAQCPSGDFATFLSAFSASSETQQSLTQTTVSFLTLKPAAEPNSFEPKTTVRSASSLAFPVMAPLVAVNTENVDVQEVDSDHFSVIDKRAGNSNIKVFSFSRTTCWALDGVEDWSIGDNDLSTSVRPGLNKIENDCNQRANAFSSLGGSGRYSLGAEFFEAALDGYVCAARSGDPVASLDAASLSLSGMTPQLSTDKVEGLLKAAATKLADGAASLSTFYCYGNSTAPEGECQHPEEAERELIRAASMGSVDAMNYLGYSFEKGELKTKDISRAMACYRLAARKGNQTASDNLQRLKAQAADVTEASQCY